MGLLALTIVGCAASPTSPPASRPGRIELAANPPAADPARVGLGFYSHVGVGAARNHEHAESFEPCATATIEQVDVWVMPAADRESDGKPVSVQVVIRAEGEAGLPGAAVCERNVSMARVALVTTGRAGSGEGEALAAAEYRLEVPIDGECRVQAGRRYFLTVSIERSDPEAHWLWQDGEDLDRTTWSRSLSATEWSRIEDVDSSLRIWGRAGPGDPPASGGR